VLNQELERGGGAGVERDHRDLPRFTGVSPAVYFERPPGQDSFFVGNF
jgi:hypothetical protein